MSGNGYMTKLITDLLYEIGAFTILITSIIILWQSNLLLLTAVIIQCLVALWFWHERYDLCFFSVTFYKAFQNCEVLFTSPVGAFRGQIRQCPPDD